MLLAKFTAPGGLVELSAAGLDQWSAMVSNMFDAAAEGNPADATDSPRAQFFNPTKTEIAADAKEAAVFWSAFPRTVLVSTPVNRDRWRKADADRDLQDEYCEWAVKRDGNGKLQSVTFTCEVPEYWDALAQDSPDRLLALYRELASPDVQMADLFDTDGRYDRKNKWNSGAEVAPVHMTQDSNTLGAAVELAAAATIQRVIDGRPLTAQQELIKCSRYGVPTRNSDPNIGASINALARERSDVTLADPPGLYISDFTPAGFKTPDGTDPHTFWSFVRGENDRAVRGVYEVPPGKGYAVGDITIADQPIEFGGQLADFVSIKIVALACRIGQSTAEPFTVCKAA